MKKLLFLMLCVCAITRLFSQELYHRVRIDLIGKDIVDLAKLGVEVDHGNIAIGRYIENDF